MQIIVNARRGGKTTKMMEWYLTDPEHRRIATINHSEAHRLYLLAKEVASAEVQEDIRESHFFPYTENRTEGHGQLEVGVDNLDMILNSMFRNRVHVVSLTE